MSDISPIGRTPGLSRAHLQPAPPVDGQSAAPSTSDRIELSANADWLDRIHQMPDVRAELVEQVRAQIAAGTYDTTDKVDAILDDLLNDITGA